MEKHKKQALFKHIRETGNISLSCKMVPVDRNLFYRCFYKDSEFRAHVNRAKAEYILKS